MKALLVLTWSLGVLVVLLALVYSKASETKAGLEAVRQAYVLGFDDGTVYALTADADSAWAPAAASDSTWDKRVREGWLP